MDSNTGLIIYFNNENVGYSMQKWDSYWMICKGVKSFYSC